MFVHKLDQLLTSESVALSHAAGTSGGQKLNRHRFQTPPICDPINLTSLIGISYVKSFPKR